jgi:hypothetical protein
MVLLGEDVARVRNTKFWFNLPGRVRKALPGRSEGAREGPSAAFTAAHYFAKGAGLAYAANDVVGVVNTVTSLATLAQVHVAKYQALHLLQVFFLFMSVVFPFAMHCFFSC